MKPALLPPEASRRTAIAIATGLAIVAILLLERARPLRRRTQPAMRRSVRNAMMGALCASVVVAVEHPLSRSIAIDNVRRRRGLAQQAPRALRPAIAFLAMDYGFYLWHVATHEVPWLWRLHRVHHVDPDLDMSTAVRFHMVDMLVSLPWRAAQVRISGIDPATLDRWQLFFTLSILIHHANLRLPVAGRGAGRADDRRRRSAGAGGPADRAGDAGAVRCRRMSCTVRNIQADP